MINIIPKPYVIKKLKGGFFTLSENTKIRINNEFKDIAALLAEYIRPATGYSLPITDNDGEIIIKIERTAILDNHGFTDESYSIKVNESRILISALNDYGAARAIQTLRQLFDPEIFSSVSITGKIWKLPQIEIVDSPKLKWRGSHLDVSRHFFNVCKVKKYIDAIALHKLNVLHLHLTDDQGWRIEIKRYPKLVEVGSKRDSTLIGHENDRPRKYNNETYSGYFSQDDIKEIIHFAAERRITILPEIDMPGHMQAAITAYPELGNCSTPPGVRCHWGISTNILNVRKDTLKFIQNILQEVIDIFPSKYIHIGGDEALKLEWEESSEVRSKMTELNINSEEDLQNWFIRDIHNFINSKGRKLIGWEEILNGEILKDTAIMNWHSGERSALKAVKNGVYVVNTYEKYLYLDSYQGVKDEEPLAIHGLITTEDIYNYNPVPEGLEGSEYLLGAQVQVWTEYMATLDKLEYMVFPRLCSFSEIVWSKSDKDYSDFVSRLDFHRLRLKALKISSHAKP